VLIAVSICGSRKRGDRPSIDHPFPIRLYSKFGSVVSCKHHPGRDATIGKRGGYHEDPSRFLKGKEGAMSSYGRKFREGWVPDALDLEGKYRVYMVAPLLPRVRFFLQKKVFDGLKGHITGCNEFLHFIRFARFRVEKGKSLSDTDLDVIRIIYDDPTNPFFIRPLVDEVRQIGPDEFLGQGMFTILGKSVWAFWFLVRK